MLCPTARSQVPVSIVNRKETMQSCGTPRAGRGKIINTASMATLLVPHPQKQIAYNASKAAVVKMTQTLACEWADRGVRVNCISPGIVNTALIQVIITLTATCSLSALASHQLAGRNYYRPFSNGLLISSDLYHWCSVIIHATCGSWQIVSSGLHRACYTSFVRSSLVCTLTKGI